MTGTIFHARGSGDASEQHLLLRGANPSTFTCLSFNAGTGLSGGIFLALDRCSLEEAAGRLGEFPKVAEFPDLLIRRILCEDCVINTYDNDQIDALKGMIDPLVPVKAFSILTPNAGLRGLSFFTTGDKTARLQAHIAFPLTSREFLDNPTMIAAIDQRKSVLPIVQEKHGLSNDALRRFARIEASLSAELRQGLVREDKVTVSSIPQLNNLELITAARCVRIDQIPEDLSGIADMADHMRVRGQMLKRLDIGESAFDRFTRRARPDQWLAASHAMLHAITGISFEAMQDVPASRATTMSVTREHEDYLKTISTAIASAVLVSLIRKEARIELTHLAATADMIWEKSDPAPQDALALKAFLNGLRGISEASRGISSATRVIRHLIGDQAGLKTLRELQERWHHTREAISGQVSTASEDISWPALTGDVVLGGVTAHEIASSQALNDQGNREAHCVGGYTTRIMDVASDKATLIFSLETPDSLSGVAPALSTVEVVLSLARDRGTETLSVKIAQNKGRRNADPGTEAHRYAEALRHNLEQLPVDRVRAYIGALSANTQSLGKDLQREIMAREGNITCPDLPERCLEAYQKVLPKSLRMLDIEDWVSMLETRSPDFEALRTRIDELIAAMKDAAPDPARQDHTTLPCPA